MKTIGENLRLLRESKSLTQNKFAARLNVSEELVREWEENKKVPDANMVILISEVFNEDVTTLLYGKKDNTNNVFYTFKIVTSGMILFAIIVYLMTMILYPLYQNVIGGDVLETYLYPIYSGIISIAGLIILCTTIINNAK